MLETFDCGCVRLWTLKMPLPIENPADCEIYSAVCFLTAKSIKAAEILSKINEVYGEDIMSEGIVRKWVKAFKYCTEMFILWNKVDDFNSLLKIWCRMFTKKWKKTDALLFQEKNFNLNRKLNFGPLGL